MALPCMLKTCHLEKKSKLRKYFWMYICFSNIYFVLISKKIFDLTKCIGLSICLSTFQKPFSENKKYRGLALACINRPNANPLKFQLRFCEGKLYRILDLGFWKVERHIALWSINCLFYSIYCLVQFYCLVLYKRIVQLHNLGFPDNVSCVAGNKSACVAMGLRQQATCLHNAVM